jgi:hypothetical protein
MKDATTASGRSIPRIVPTIALAAAALAAAVRPLPAG